ncbi:MAG: LptE family protein [Bacteroidetes bacterium]|nr:LptE family protein [Bacteroidota bacterium]MBS1628847.1 LptE family protein [Bacteroidota bacterium]
MKLPALIAVLTFFLALTSCGVYSLSGASVEGKTIRFSMLDNKARNVVPTLAPALTEKLRSRILSQTGLTSQNGPAAEPDYELSGSIMAYEVTVSAVQNTQQASQNRLTITVHISFKNNISPKASFEQDFSRFADFPASQSLQSVQSGLMDQIGDQLADDIFNKAFVNW